MNTSAALLWLLVAVFAAFGVLSLWLKSELARLRELAKWSGKYSSTVKELLRDGADPLPRAVINSLEFWNRAVVDKNFPRRYALTLMTVRQQILAGEDVSRKDDEETRAFMRAHPKFEEHYVNAIVYAMMTISYSHWFWGKTIRSTIADIYVEHQKRRVQRVARAVQHNVKLSDPSDRLILAA